MIKYNFKNNELWFSRRALQELACADRLSFSRHAKRVERSKKSKAWRQDEVCLSRIEGGRKVRRRSTIFDLDTSYLIMLNYRKSIPPDFWCVLDRFKELIREKRAGILEVLKTRKEYAWVDESVLEDKELTDVLIGSDLQDNAPKKKIILDYWDNKFNLVTEGEDEKRELWPRSMFRFSV